MRHFFLNIIFLTASSLCFAQETSVQKREFRGVWVATLNAIDWPYSEKDSADQQKEDFISLLDFHQKRGINAVIVQVRSSADVIYPSNIEPWCSSLSGKMGEAPKPFYDPLAFMIAETHKRGMEFHAWVNPFRAVTNIQSVKVSSDHVYKKHPEWILKYHNLAILNPGIPAARKYIESVIEEIISNYDIDALHFDDYFYPYPDHGEIKADRAAYRKYRAGNESIRDWRRANVNTFIEDIHALIIEKRPSLKFGVSPYGVWRNVRDDQNGSPTRSGYTSYDHLYADVRLWLQNGWIDYVAPQAYQSTKHRNIPFKELITWWSENSFGRHLYAGHATYRVQTSLEKGWRDNSEMPSQLYHTRSSEQIHGSVFYNSTSLLYNQGGMADSLKNIYKVPALLPLMPWIDGTNPNPPEKPSIAVGDEGIELKWQNSLVAEDGDLATSYVIYSTKAGKLPNINDPREILCILSGNVSSYIDKRSLDLEKYTYLISALDRIHNESEAVLPIYPKEQNVILPAPFNEDMIVELNEAILKATWEVVDRVVDSQGITMIKEVN
ncbi:glycoside hydrolase [Flammeovirga pectinis]|uniref:Glycoside hydrolase n=1 Tax=Flammeovirga pectinis TaxID=2494373 RepID=A0A3S9P2W9_9BACT|nr:family 10 glycosylhydrolase [Flammeovirga pectinis]AZQ62547.1 glycoside hydrolase [Flammeovirga pectinis]